MNRNKTLHYEFGGYFREELENDEIFNLRYNNYCINLKPRNITIFLSKEKLIFVHCPVY